MIDRESLRPLIELLIDATNRFDVDVALSRFTPNAVIEDVSVGDKFLGHAGIRVYIEQFFVGYHTVTRLLSVAVRGKGRASVRVDFTGDFGHEVGLLEISFNADGLIDHIDADLE
jgi:hypothetical protein